MCTVVVAGGFCCCCGGFGAAAVACFNFNTPLPPSKRVLGVAQPRHPKRVPFFC
ncbi:hypothetical protein PR003_g21003 [Phytophthora rubi]|uniref:Uncharacterized protein n=1 Tax=Phytophthora rubi TaxID=129364 RepID=A0A6A4DHU2_9STRA|nr:hypothetical protein PR003_g21003 [Phytophthora rubi]